jgi:hypothetical protein
MTRRFQDQGEHWTDFAAAILVRCPRCDGCATLTAPGPAPEGGLARRLVCPACAYARDGLALGDAPLWLRTPCCGEELWAFNADHLAFLERYVAADLRENPAPGAPLPRGIRNATLASRLPAWMKRARNRDDVLRGLARLRAALP